MRSLKERCCLLSLVVAVIFFASGTGLAQQQVNDEDPDLQQGLKAFGVYQGGQFDSVDVTTTKLTVHIPLLSYPQLGKLHLNYSVAYDSPTFAYICIPITGCDYEMIPTTLHDMTSVASFNDLMPYVQYYDSYDSHNNYLYTDFTLTEPSGANHHMAAVAVGSGATQQLRTIDGTGYFASESSWSDHPVVYDANGTSYDHINWVVKDVYANQITENVTTGAITDSVNRPIPQIGSGPAGNLSLCTSGATSSAEWIVPAQNVGTVTFQFCAKSGLVTDIILPNGTAWRFAYENYTEPNGQDISTELKEITLPTGGTITYTWQTINNGAPKTTWRGITSRVVDANDGNGPQTWTYVWGTGWPGTRVLTITDPLGNSSVHTMQEFAYTSTAPLWKESNVQYYDHTQGLLQTVATDYGSNTPPPFLPIGITKEWAHQQAKTSKSYGAQFNPYWHASKNNGALPTLLVQVAPTYFTANPYVVTDSDYGNGAPGGTLRSTTTYYQAFGTNNVCSGNYCNANLLNLPLSVAVTGSGNSATTKYFYDAGGGTRGSLTSIQRLLGGSYITTDTMTYTSHGMLLSKSDALGHPTSYTYDSEGLFPVLIKNALQQPTQYDYDENTGVLNSEIDPNNNETSYTYDEMNNITSVHRPDGGSTTYTYNYEPPNPSVVVEQAITSSLQKEETGIVDGLGRLIHTQLNSDPEGVDYVDITYDGLGRRVSLTNPYRTTSNALTQYKYDALSRLIQQTQPDNSTITYGYVDNTVTVTDEAGKARKSQSDGLGRSTYVWEDPSGLDYETDYAYDCLSNLITVTQKGAPGTGSSQWRSFVYDSLSRMTDATNPESTHISYTYNNDGTLINKYEYGRGITTTYTPDPLHRITSKSYSSGDPTVSYFYDGSQTSCGAPIVTSGNGIGRRTGMCDGSGGGAWWYDPMGRVVHNNKIITGYATADTYYDYNLDGSLAVLTYPSEDYIEYSYNAAGRVADADWVGALEGWSLAENISYTPAGAIARYTSGDGSTVTKAYNSRLQPSTIEVNGQQGDIVNLTYDFHEHNGDNGNVMGISNSVHPTWGQSFSYDSVNRIYTANVLGGGDQYGYDAWGNLLSKTPIGGSGETWSVVVDSSNHMVGYGYDPAGNLNSVSGVLYNTFNAENQWVTQSSYHASFLYDGDGRRVKTSEVGGVPEVTYYWNNESGNVLVESDSYLHIWNEYFYLNGERVAYVTPSSGATYFYYNDHLGNVRAITDNYQNKCFEADYYPWGNTIPGTVSNTCSTQYFMFTGKARDPMMGVDYFGARFYKGDMARFYSPDLVNVTNERLQKPSSTLNKYTYAADNPLKFIDPDGSDVTVFYDQGGIAGHSILFAYDQTTGASAIESFGPEYHLPLAPGVPMYEMSSFRSADDLRQNLAALTIQTTPEVAEQVIAYIRDNPDPSLWFVDGPNCTTQVWKVLQAFKLALKQHLLDDNPQIPAALWQTLISQFNPAMGGAPKNGTDYGHPRAGFDMFTLMWQSIAQFQQTVQKQPQEVVTHKIDYNTGDSVPN